MAYRRPLVTVKRKHTNPECKADVA